MSDQRFKELLNLYLDHRLSEAEAVEFERALLADAARRKTLRDYCLIQGGCAELFARSAAQAPSSSAVCRSLRVVEARISRAGERGAATWSWRSWSAGLGMAGAGLAACATILVVVRTGGSSAQAPTEVAQAPAPVALVRTAQTEVEPAVVVAASVASAAVPVAITGGEAISERQRARNLTLAALGLTMDEPAAARSTGKYWADVRETHELANLSPAARSWIIATSASEASWAQAQSRALSMQMADNNGWAPSGASSYQVDSASYRFER